MNLNQMKRKVIAILSMMAALLLAMVIPVKSRVGCQNFPTGSNEEPHHDEVDEVGDPQPSWEGIQINTVHDIRDCNKRVRHSDSLVDSDTVTFLVQDAFVIKKEKTEFIYESSSICHNRMLMQENNDFRKNENDSFQTAEKCVCWLKLLTRVPKVRWDFCPN